MKYTITVELDEAPITECVREAWAAAFKRDSYGGNSAPGRRQVERQVAEFVCGLDLLEQIAASCKAQLAPVVDEAVREALKKRARELAKEMQANGTLLGEETP